MPGVTECVVSAGSGIRLQWSEAQDGSINLSICLITGVVPGGERPGSVSPKPLLKHSNRIKNNSNTILFQFSEGLSVGSTRRGLKSRVADKSDQNKVRADQSRGNQSDDDDNHREDSHQSGDDDDNHYEDGHQSEDENQSVDDDHDSRHNSRQQDGRSNSAAGDEQLREPCQTCRELSENIKKKWSERQDRVRQLSSLWARSPGEFFGNTEFHSSEQWSFRALSDFDKKLNQERNPFHKLNLANHLRRRIERSKLPELNCRKAMLQELYPGFEKMDRRERDPLYKRFERYIEQGQVLASIAEHAPGLLLMIAAALTTLNFDHLSKEWKACASKFGWLNSVIIEESKQYEETVTNILTYMQPNSKRTAAHDSPTSRKRQWLEDGILSGQLNTGSHRPETFQEGIPAILDQPVYRGRSSSSSSSSPPLLLTPLSWVSSSPTNEYEEFENCNAKKSLSSLISAIGSLPKFLLEQAVSPQKRWDEFGVEYQADPRNPRFGADLRDLLLDSSKMWQNLEYLISIAAIGVEKSDCMEAYISGSASAVSLSRRQRSYWIEQAFWLFCYIFPRNPISTPVSEKEKLLVVLEHLLRSYADIDLEIPSEDEVIETFLAASRFGPLTRRRLILSWVDRLLEESTSIHLRAEAVYQRSVVLRLKGDIASSNWLLQEFLDRSNMASEIKSHHVLGRLHLSRAANYAYSFDFSSANTEVQKWNPLPSTITEEQLEVVWNQIHSVGRILRGQGFFDKACLFFERCLQIHQLRESKRYLALSHLADTYIELDYLRSHEINSHYAGELLDKAENLVKVEVEQLRSRSCHSKGFRRLLLSLSEIEIRRCRFEEAEHALIELCGIYKHLADPDIVDRLGHIRTFIALARIPPASESETRWTNALNIGRKYYPLEEEVFIVALIHLFICTIRLHHGDSEGGKAAFDYAADICRTKSPQFLIPGAGTYMFDEVQCQIQSLTGWKLPR